MKKKEKRVEDKMSTITPSVKILYDDKQFLVVDKPAGMVVNRSETLKSEITLQDWLIQNVDVFKDIQLFNQKKDDFYSRAGIVHRLDRETSGVLIVAKDEKSFKNLQDQFSDRQVKKTYITLVYGKIKIFDTSSELEVNAPIGRNPFNREKYAIVEGGRSAVTNFKLDKIIQKEDRVYSLMFCYPKTGRTHQIRVHLTALGNPVVGDKLYSGKKRSQKNLDAFPRQMLHASEITFKHPKNNNEVTVRAPLPKDFNDVLEEII